MTMLDSGTLKLPLKFGLDQKDRLRKILLRTWNYQETSSRHSNAEAICQRIEINDNLDLTDFLPISDPSELADLTIAQIEASINGHLGYFQKNAPEQRSPRERKRTIANAAKQLERSIELLIEMDRGDLDQLDRSIQRKHHSKLTATEELSELVGLLNVINSRIPSKVGRPREQNHYVAVATAAALMTSGVKISRSDNSRFAQILAIVYEAIGLPDQSVRVAIDSSWNEILDLLANARYEVEDMGQETESKNP